MNSEKIQEIVKKEWKIGFLEKIMNIIRSFSITEKFLFVLFSIIFIASSLSLLYKVNKAFLVEVPDYGGTLNEGVVGSPRFINPLLASTDTDRDLTNLIYSGLLKSTPSGDLVPDIAESYTISEDGLVYTFTLKDDVYFHDGVKLTTDDILFTIEKAQDTLLKSPREANWAGVKIDVIDEKTISFTLKLPYSPFIQNTTLGILPKHIWKDASIEEFPFSKFNTNPIGTGPYKVESVSISGSGLPQSYHLISFNKYTLGRPFITNIIFKSYQNEKDLIAAFKKGDIDSVHGISPKLMSELDLKDKEVMLSPLPRIFGVFFNQNSAPVLLKKEVRQALDIATNKQALVDIILNGYGQAIDSPVPFEEIATNTEGSNATTTNVGIEKARELLEKNGWKRDESGTYQKKETKSTTRLAFSISTGNVPELKEAAYLLQQQWQLLGAEVEVKVFEVGDLNQNIIKPRKYDALLFGIVVGRDIDLYPFWHSSERNSPGLNVAMYTNSKADKLLENIRKTNDRDEQKGYLESFEKEIKNDTPAVFTYSPYFIYVVPNKIKNINLGLLTNSGERFVDVSKWYIETSNVWKIFRSDN